MKTFTKKYFVAALFFIGSFHIPITLAFAHRVSVFAWVEEDTIHVESKFSGGNKVKAGKIVVMDSQGVELLSGLTSEEGTFSFKIPKQTDLKIVLVAGQGHQGEWTIPASELKKVPSAIPAKTRTDIAIGAEQKKQALPPSQPHDLAAPEPAFSQEELQIMIESALDRKLQPITRMLINMSQERPTVRDILAGIGYIMGLVGMAAYVHNRKKKM
jgi:nickel transport protein